MFTPYAVLLVLFAIVPIGLAFSTSLKPSLANPEGGFANYLFVINDFRFWPAVINISTFLAIYLPSMVIVVASLSLLLDAIKSRWSVPLRLAYLVPASITGAVAILVWYFMLEPKFSPFKGILLELGLTSGSQIFAQTKLVWVFALMAFFTGAGNWIVIQYGSLQSISEDILEAAKIDGANVFQTALQIKLPLIRKYLIYMTILTFAAGLQIFVEPYLLSSSVYPNIARDWSLNQLSYSLAFSGANLGAATALSLMLLLVCVIAALLVIFRTDFFDEARMKED
ncbi:MAG: sugar ABC transporter permease [Aquiluna sp.]|nr:sugar ABC transporter permease [Aquiluna sp.]